MDHSTIERKAMPLIDVQRASNARKRRLSEAWPSWETGLHEQWSSRLQIRARDDVVVLAPRRRRHMPRSRKPNSNFFSSFIISQQTHVSVAEPAPVEPMSAVGDLPPLVPNAADIASTLGCTPCSNAALANHPRPFDNSGSVSSR